MKKLIEVVQYNENDIRFNTDLEVEKNPETVSELTARFAFTMVTKLWGGNELSVLAMIRALAIADLAVSVNRKDMIKMLDQASGDLAKALRQAEQMMRRSGMEIQTFGPGVKPPKCRS